MGGISVTVAGRTQSNVESGASQLSPLTLESGIFSIVFESSEIVRMLRISISVFLRQASTPGNLPNLNMY